MELGLRIVGYKYPPVTGGGKQEIVILGALPSDIAHSDRVMTRLAKHRGDLVTHIMVDEKRRQRN